MLSTRILNYDIILTSRKYLARCSIRTIQASRGGFSVLIFFRLPTIFHNEILYLPRGSLFSSLQPVFKNLFLTSVKRAMTLILYEADAYPLCSAKLISLMFRETDYCATLTTVLFLCSRGFTLKMHYLPREVCSLPCEVCYVAHLSLV